MTSLQSIPDVTDVQVYPGAGAQILRCDCCNIARFRVPDPALCNINMWLLRLSTYGHRQMNIEDPVRSPVLKHLTARLVLRWVTTWESRVLYVLPFFGALTSGGDNLSLAIKRIGKQRNFRHWAKFTATASQRCERPQSEVLRKAVITT